MNIGIFGAGNVGGTLGKGWAKKGHTVRYGVREPKSAKTQAVVEATGAGASAAGMAELSGWSEVLVLATPWPATRDALGQAGELSGKVLLDCTNPLNEKLGLDVGYSTSGAEIVAGWAPGARVVKIFNTTGSPNMANPKYGGEAATMFYCGDDGEAKQIAHQLAADIGFDPVDAGGLTQARLLEPLAMLWISMAVLQKKGTGMALKLMRR